MALVWEYETELSRPIGVQTGYLHRLEIVDTQGGISGTFCGTDEGVVYRQEGRSRSLWQDIQPASITFTMIIENATHVAFIDGLKQFTEKRFIVRYYRAGQLFFVGVVLADEIVTRFGNNITSLGASNHPHGRYTVTAVDGISLLKEIAYQQDDGLPWLVPATPAEIITRCLQKMPTAGNGQRIAYVTNWTPDTGGGPNFESNVKIHGRNLLEESRQGGYKFFSCYEVLKQLCLHFDMRIYYIYNVYWFEQINTKVTGGSVTLTDFNNIPGGTLSSAGGGNIIDCDRDWRLAEDIRAHKPPLRTVTTFYEFDIAYNVLEGNTWEMQTAQSDVCFTGLGPLPITNTETRFTLKGNIEFVYKVNAGTYTGPVRTVFFFKIKLGTQYFVRELIDTNYIENYSNFNPQEWTTTAGYWTEPHPHQYIMPQDELIKLYHPFFITSLPIPTSLDAEELEICFRHETYGENNVLIAPGNIQVSATIKDADAKVIDREDNIVEETTIATTVLNSTDNSKNISRTLLFSDGPVYSERKMTGLGFNPPDTSAWTIPGIGTFPHYEALARSIMARGMQTQEFLEGAICGPTSGGPYLYDGKLWIFMRGEYISGKETWAGEWLRLELGNAGALTKITEEVFKETGGPTSFIAGGGGTGLRPVCRIVTDVQQNINVDSIGLPVPDTTGWTNEQIDARLEVYKQGIWQRYVSPGPARVDEWEWDNTNRLIKLGEQTRTGDWTKLRVWV